MTPAANPNPRQVAFTWWTIWVAMTISLGLLLVVLYAGAGSGSNDERRIPPPELARNLAFAAAALAFGAIAVRRFLHSDPRLRAAAEQVAQLPKEQRELAFLARMQGALVTSLAMHEAVGLVGFVIALLYQEPARFWPFLAAALVLNLIATPRPQALLARARELCPRFAALVLILALGAGCSFVGGDFTPMKTEPETPCLKEANEICKEKLKSADIGNCVAREKYRCELQEQQDKERPATPESS